MRPRLVVALAAPVAAGLLAAGCGGPGGRTTPGTSGMSGTSSTSTAPTASAAPVPNLFQPSTVSFVSARTGYALGVAACAPDLTSLCPSLARTDDGGGHWRSVTVPPLVDLTDPAHRPLLRFASAAVGFATDGRPGSGVLVTRDGGDHWTRLTGLPTSAAVTALGVGAGHLLVVAGDATARRMYAAPVTAAVLAATGPALAGTGGVVDVAVTDDRAYVVSSPVAAGVDVTALRSTDFATWAEMPVPCSTAGSAMVAAEAGRVLLACTGTPTDGATTKTTFVSRDGGGQFTVTGSFSGPGRLVGVAIGPPTGDVTPLTVATTADADQLFASRDDGRTYSLAYASAVGDQGQGLSDLAYVDAQHGFAVLGDTGAYAVALASGGQNVPGSRLLTTADAGAHWTQIQVRP